MRTIGLFLMCHGTAWTAACLALGDTFGWRILAASIMVGAGSVIVGKAPTGRREGEK